MTNGSIPDTPTRDERADDPDHLADDHDHMAGDDPSAGDHSTDEPASNPADEPASLPDPGSMRDRDGIRFEERTVVDDREHFETHEAHDGIVIVGVTDGDGRVLVLARDEDHAILPHGPVDEGEDYVAAAHAAIDEQLDVEVTIDGVASVRHQDHRLVGDEDRRTTSYRILFRASPADGPVEEVTVSRDCWEARWTDEVPANPDWNAAEVREDVRLFVE